MKTIALNLYTLDELDENAKKVARKQCGEFSDIAAQASWDDAQSTLDTLQEMTRCTFNIDESSHGFYTKVTDNKYNDYPYYDDRHDDRRFNRLRAKIKEMKTNLWTDDLLKDAAARTEYDSGNRWEDFATALGRIVDKFCTMVNNDSWQYYSDEYIDSEIKQSECYFLKSGKLYCE